MTSKTRADEAQRHDIAHPLAALDAAIEAARLANPVVTGTDGRQHAFLPEGYALKELPDDTRLPPYATGHVVVDDRASLVNYANRFQTKQSIIIADFDAGRIGASLDWHPDNQHDQKGKSGANRHHVTLALRFSEEFTRWNGFANKLHEQEVFARFLEENASDVGHPEAAAMIELSRDFEATVGQVYKSAVRLDNGDRRMVFETETKAQNSVVIPQRFTLSIPIYNGEEPDELTCLFRWRAAGGGQVQLGFDWHRVEHQRRAHFTQIAYAAAEETGLPVFMGRHT